MQLFGSILALLLSQCMAAVLQQTIHERDARTDARVLKPNLTVSAEVPVVDLWRKGRCQKFYAGDVPEMKKPIAAAFDHKSSMYLRSEESPDPAVNTERVVSSRAITVEDIVVPPGSGPPLNPDYAYKQPWDGWEVPYFVRTPMRASKVATGTVGGRSVLVIGNWKVATSTFSMAMKQEPFTNVVDFHDATREGCVDAFHMGSPCKHTTFSVKDIGSHFKVAFVRDPWLRFMASANPHLMWGPDEKKNRADVRIRAKKLFEYPVSERNEHMKSQSYVLSSTDSHGVPLNYDFIGRLENMGGDIKKLGIALGEDFSRLLEVHENPSGDKLRIDQVSADLLQDEEIVCLVCRTYIQDYICFGYELPKTCCEGKCWGILDDDLYMAGC